MLPIFRCKQFVILFSVAHLLHVKHSSFYLVIFFRLCAPHIFSPPVMLKKKENKGCDISHRFGRFELNFIAVLVCAMFSFIAIYFLAPI